MRKTSLTSKDHPSKRQVCRVQTLATEAVNKTVEKCAWYFTNEGFQAVHSAGGRFKDGFEPLFLEYFRSFIRKELSIVTPVRAHETGLVPRGWEVLVDDLEGDVRLTALDYSFSPVPSYEDSISSFEMFEKARGVYGSLGFAAALLQAQKEGRDVFPVEARAEHCFLMPRTILVDTQGDRRIGRIYWDKSRSCWSLMLSWAERVTDRFSRTAHFIRPRQQ